MASATSRRLVRVAAATIATLMLVACGGGGAAVEVPPDPAVGQTAAGPVRGTVADDHRYFAGIPYAAPPVGPLRWEPPAPAVRWTELRDATRPGSRCVQDTSTDLDKRPTSEDCLTLNVWTPPPSDDPKPVMVWIHGGGFFNGSGDIYEARRLASRGDIVVVTINYRLGALGFLAHPALGTAGAVGNYGLADQQAALRWVRDNIAGFGGDPDKVTIAGESAGGMSVCDHLVAPESAGLFRAAIIQSAPCQAQYDLPNAQKASEMYAGEIGCENPAVVLECLRTRPAEKFQKGLQYGRIGTERLSGPVTGTPTLPVNPVVGIAEGRAVRVPVMIGINHDEFTLFAAIQHLRGRPMSAPDYPGLLEEAFGRQAAAVAQQYPLERFGGSVPLAYSAATTDSDFACVADLMSDRLARDQPVYGYEFNDRDAPAPQPLREVPFPVGASHSLELRYLFDVGGAPSFDATQQRLSDEMIDCWSRFVSTENPGDGWPKLGDRPPEERMSLQQGGNTVVSTFDSDHRCAFWAGLRG